MRISDWSSDVCSSDLKTVVPVIASHRCIGSREPSGKPRILGEGKCGALFDGRPEMIHENRLAREGQFMVDVTVAVGLRWSPGFEDRTCRRQVKAERLGVAPVFVRQARGPPSAAEGGRGEEGGGK